MEHEKEVGTFYGKKKVKDIMGRMGKYSKLCTHLMGSYGEILGYGMHKKYTQQMGWKILGMTMI